MLASQLALSKMSCTAAIVVLTGCSGIGAQGGSDPGADPSGASAGASHGGALPDSLIPYARGVLMQIPTVPDATAPASAKAHIYVSEFGGSNVLGYAANNSKNKPPDCTFFEEGTEADDLGADDKGNLFYPSYASHVIDIYGPNCGPLLGSISDPYGPPNDATAANGIKGKIAVSNGVANSHDGPGSLLMQQSPLPECSLTDAPSPRREDGLESNGSQ